MTCPTPRLLLLLVSFIQISLFNDISAQCGSLVWSDEFDGTALNESDWLIQTGTGSNYGLDFGWGNGELSNYQSNNVEVSDGTLKLKAYQNGRSGRIETQGLNSWKYGRFEISAKLPEGTGLWPAFWMLGENNDWPETGEIDIMEYRGDQPNKWYGTVHYGTNEPYNHQHMGTEKWLENGSFSDGFHEFAMEWEPQEIRWYVNGNLWQTMTPNETGFWPWDDQPFYIILNLAVGGTNTGFTGNQAPSFADGSVYEVDYVRVYSSATPTVNWSGPSKMLTGDTATFSVESATDVSYTWTTDSELSIIGSNTGNQISVVALSDGLPQISLTAAHGANGTCANQTFEYSRLVTVNPNACDFIWTDFNDNQNVTNGYTSGWLSIVNNPSPDGVNNSSGVGKYERSATQWDVLFFDDVFIRNGERLADETYVIAMDVWTDVAPGATVHLEIINDDYFIGGAAGGPGIHSTYQAQTTTSGQWETLYFSFTEYKDANRDEYVDNLNRLSILFDLAATSASTWYFDNLRQVHHDVAPLSISGSSSVGVGESVEISIDNTTPGMTYEWTLPSGATLNSGQGTSTISATMNGTSGLFECVVVPADGCEGKLLSHLVTVTSNPCALYAEEFDAETAMGYISHTAGFDIVESEGELVITKTNQGDEWANIDLSINDGNSDITIDLEKEGNDPILIIRAKATSNALLRVTLEDETDYPAGNQYLEAKNSLELTTEWQEFEIDFSGQFWNGSSWESWWPYPDEMDVTKIDAVNLAINPGYDSFPFEGDNQTYNTNFDGDVLIDYIHIRPDCPDPEVQIDNSLTTVCLGDPITFTNASIGLADATDINWSFGADASPNEANTSGPHTITYSTEGTKNITLTINDTLSTSVQITVDDTPCQLSVDETIAFSTLSYPNPFMNGTTFKGEVSGIVVIIDIQGQIVENIEYRAHETLNLGEGWTPGAYQLIARFDNKVFVQRLIKLK